MNNWIEDAIRKDSTVDIDNICYFINSNKEAISIAAKNWDTEYFSERPIDGILEYFFESMSLILKYTNNTKEVNHVSINDIKAKTPYTISPDGTCYECDVFNHTGFYIAWAMKYHKDYAFKWLTKGEVFVTSDMLDTFHFVEFVSDGKDINTIGADSQRIESITRKQAEVLLKLYEINGIADKYFTDVEKYLTK